MKIDFRSLSLRTLGLVCCVAVSACEREQPSMPDVQPGKSSGLPLKGTRTARFTTSEGTWMSLDVSPDGKTIVFDLLGDLYTIPIAGGTAKRLTSGMAFDGQPRYSPDGKSIVFVSDGSGSDNVSVVDANGGSPRQVTREDTVMLQSPVWTPDGKGIVVLRYKWMSPQDLVAYPLAGGAGMLIKTDAEQYVMGPVWSHDRRTLYFSKASNRRPLLGGWLIAAYDRGTGGVSVLIKDPGGAVRPVLSPDGRYLVYGTRIEGPEPLRQSEHTALKLFDLKTKQTTVLVPKVQFDTQIDHDDRDLLPGSAFTPDGKALITFFEGKIWRVEVPSGNVTPIPFAVQVEQQLGPLPRFTYPIEDGALTAKQIRDAVPSPAGRQIAFSALSHLWAMDLADGKPRRLTSMEGVGEHSPTWSPDGRYIVYVTWSDLLGGQVYRVRADGQGSPEALTGRSAFYDKPAYSPDGSRIYVAHGSAEDRRATTEGSARNIQLGWLPASGGPLRTIARLVEELGYSSAAGSYGRVHFVKGSDRLFIRLSGEGLVSMQDDGTRRRTILKPSESVDEVVLSPTGDRALVLDRYHLYLISLLPGDWPTVAIDIGDNVVNPYPVRKITRVGADFPGWRADGSGFFYSLGRSFFEYDLAAESAAAMPRDTQGAAQADKKTVGHPTYEPKRTDVTVTVARDKPAGVLALRGARIITMKGAEVIENGDIVIRDNRIAAVGARGSVQIPADATVIDVAGKTILPGYVDVHTHIRPSWGVHRTQAGELLSMLAFGATTMRDPSPNSTDVFSYEDLLETGALLGPRLYCTGPAIGFGALNGELDDARDLMRRHAELWNTQTIKQYFAGYRRVRQSIIMAAAEHHLTSTTEGINTSFKIDLTQVIDGYPQQEHNFPTFPWFGDVLQLMAQSGTILTPTASEASYPSAAFYYFNRVEAAAAEKMARFDPPTDNMKTVRGRRGSEKGNFLFSRKAASLAALVKAGGKISMGSHTGVGGDSVHMELWTIASGGMPLHDVLRAGTIWSAESIGLLPDLGSLEVGKLADLQVLEKNPLEDVFNTTSIVKVMKNGRLYDANTLDELWPRQSRLSRQWWWK